MRDPGSLYEEINKRIERFQHLLRQDGIDGALIVQKIDRYYLSGTDQDAHLWVPASGPPVLMVRKSLERALQDSPINRIVPLKGFSELPEHLASYGEGNPSTIGLEMDVLPVRFYLAYRRHFPGAEMVDVSHMLRTVRMVKSPYEIERASKAAELADQAYQKIPEFLSESKREIDLTLRVEAFYRSHGHPGVIPTRNFNTLPLYGQIMSGPRAAVPSDSAGPLGGIGLGPFHSAGSSLQRIMPHEPIVVDYAALLDGYISDQTRIYSKGALDEPFHRAHETALRVQRELSEKGRPGVRACDLYDLALQIADKAGFSRGFMGFPDPVPFVGHGVGLELDEWPVIGRGNETPLSEGMVIALEPKIVIPGKGVVGIENTFLVTDKGMKRLNHLPDEICIC